MKVLALLLVLVPLSPLFAAPAKKRAETLGQGIQATITLSSSAAGRSADEAIRRAFQEGRKVFGNFDMRRAGEVARINQNAGKGMTAVSEDLLRLLRVCMRIFDWTDGLFDVVKAKSGGEGKDHQLQVDFGKREVALPDRGTYLDFHGILNGFVIDRMAGILKSEGFADFLIQAGENYRTMGRNGRDYWRLNIPDPQGGKMLCRVSLESASVATADIRDLKGAQARVGKTASGPTDLQSVTVITKNATNATALSSTALLVGKAKAREILSRVTSAGFGAILEDQDGKITTIGDVTAACFEG